MDFITKIYGLILNLIKTILGMFNVDTAAVDELLAELEKLANPEEDDTATTV